jgi:hypothetical protein
MLRGEATRESVQQAVQEVGNTVTTFVSLLLKEEEKQSRAAGDGAANVMDNNQCKR